MNRKKKLIISALFLPEPVVSAKLSFDIAQALSFKEEVTVISPNPSRPLGFKFETSIEINNFNHIVLNSYTCPKSTIMGRFLESYSFGKLSSKYISTHYQNLSMIYANTWPLFSQYLAVRTAKKFGIPIVIHVQDIYPESLINKIPLGKSIVYSILKPIDKFILQNSTSIIVISQNMKDYLIKTREIEENKVFVVPNWQDESNFININYEKESIKDEHSLYTFMYLGNIGPVAGVDLLVDAFALADISDARLIIAGSGSMKEELQKKIQKYPKCRIELWQVPEGKVAQIQSMADIMLLPIKKGAGLSSIPSKLPAYMFSKKAIIATVDADSDTAYAIRNAKCGWVLPPENLSSLAQKLKMVVSLPKDEVEIFGENGYNYALNNFSKNNNLKKVINILEQSIH